VGVRGEEREREKREGNIKVVRKIVFKQYQSS